MRTCGWCDAAIDHMRSDAKYCSKQHRVNAGGRRRAERYPGYYMQFKGYGLSYVDYCAMVVAQDGKCACCGDEMGSPRVDHDHDSGLVRGLLCNNCNVGIGMFREDPARLEAAVRYLASHEAVLPA